VALLHRSPTLPGSQRARLALAAGDGVLAAAPLTGDRWAVATRRALYLLDDESVERWSWSQVDHGSLDAESGRLTVRLVTGTTVDLPLAARTGRTFAAAFRERVQSSVVRATEVAVPGAGTVQIAVRRDEDGRLFTQVLGDERVDLTRPEVAGPVDEAEQRLREAVGLPI
jgi:hypothetical protein